MKYEGKGFRQKSGLKRDGAYDQGVHQQVQRTPGARKMRETTSVKNSAVSFLIKKIV